MLLAGSECLSVTAAEGASLVGSRLSATLAHDTDLECRASAVVMGETMPRLGSSPARAGSSGIAHYCVVRQWLSACGRFVTDQIRCYMFEFTFGMGRTPWHTLSTAAGEYHPTSL